MPANSFADQPTTPSFGGDNLQKLDHSPLPDFSPLAQRIHPLGITMVPTITGD
jgi:hypothetical protein